MRETLGSLQDGAWPNAGSCSPGRSSGDDAPLLRVGRRAAGCSSRLGEGLRGPEANPSASDRRAAQGVSPQGNRSRLVFVIVGGAAALRAGPRLARPSRSLSRATRSGSPSRLSAPSLARPVLRSSEWKGCRLRRSNRRSGRIGFWSVSTIRSLRRAAESVIHSDPTRRDDHCSRAYPGYVMAFTCRLQGGAAPMGPNPLDAPPSITAVASLGAVGPPAVSAQPLGPSPPPPTPPLPVYSTTQQPADALASGR